MVVSRGIIFLSYVLLSEAAWKHMDIKYVCTHIYIYTCIWRFTCNCLQYLSHKKRGGKEINKSHLKKELKWFFKNSWVKKQLIFASERTHAGSCKLSIQQRIVPAKGLYWAHIYVNLCVNPSVQAVLQNIPSQIWSPKIVKLLHKFIIQKLLARERHSPWFCTSKSYLAASAQEITSLSLFLRFFFSILLEIHQNAWKIIY